MAEITLRQVEYFVATVDQGSVTKASQQCRVSQAAVSMAISELEKTMGIKLLVRNRTSGVRATAAGTRVATLGRRMMDLAAELGKVATEENDGLTGTIRVGCIYPVSAHLLPSILTYFRENHPAVRVEFQEGSTVALAAGLGSGQLDVIITFETQAPANSTAEKLVDFRQHVMLSSMHPLAAEKAISFTQLSSDTAILYDVPPSGERVEAMIRASGVVPDIRWSSSRSETIRELVRYGLGYSVVNLFDDAWIGKPGEPDGVVYIPVDSTLADNSIVVMTPRGARPPRRVRELIEHCRQATKSWEWVHQVN